MVVRIDIDVVGHLQGATRLQNFNMDAPKNNLVTGMTDILTDAKGIVHTQSGKLKSSGNLKVTGNEVIVSFPMHYASIEEFRIGGRKGPSHAYLRPAIQRHRQRTIDRVITSIRI